MSIDAARGLLACPVCAGALTAAGGAWACRRGHSFDVARHGYLNLLNAAPPANADSPAMVAARERLLGSGLFRPVTDEAARRLSRAAVILDVGAGTGHHLAAVLDRSPEARGVALDVSVAAARRASRAHARAASVVGDVWAGLPVLPGRVDAVLCVFAPRNLAEFARVLAPGGVLVVVTPNPSHLQGLRERHGLLGIEGDKDERLLRTAAGHVEPVGRRSVDFTAAATAQQVHDLIAMGPNAFHGVPVGVEPADVRVSVTVWWFRRPGVARR